MHACNVISAKPAAGSTWAGAEKRAPLLAQGVEGVCDVPKGKVVLVRLPRPKRLEVVVQVLWFAHETNKGGNERGVR